MIEDVPFIKQLPELPRGCEVTSLAMFFCNIKGVQVDKMQLASEIHRVPFEQNGLRVKSLTRICGKYLYKGRAWIWCVQ